MSDASPARDAAAAAPSTVRLQDYTPPVFAVDAVSLEFDLQPSATRVRAVLDVVRETADEPLVLVGECMELLSLRIDGVDPDPARWTRTDHELRIDGLGDKARIETEVLIDPSANTALEGLYMSCGRFYTQCEAEGFRRITYFLDRPDVMARYRVRITADRERFPILLSNGNPAGQGVLDDGRHWAQWDDPFPKPSYLFALFAGDLACLEDSFRTRSGRTVALRIYADARDLDKCGHAMTSLKASMDWDERVYGLEYDLDIFNVVAVGDFNMGAMENKSLNIFNTKCILAKPETATDADFAAVESVVAHEYFHNWTGNRVTCRDWFQLSLKEGLTVFRDQQFSADMGSPAVTRISDVQMLRAHQFPEDAGPLAHPVRPDAYIEINNFYTATVYQKGAEVIRMMHRILGADNFRKGMDLYFERHDGQAVTCDDFVAAMADASGIDLGPFKRWYHQAGTPTVRVERRFDAATGDYHLTFRQETPPTPGQKDKEPLHIPVALGLIGGDGQSLDFTVDSNDAAANDKGDDNGTVTLNLCDREQTFTVRGLKAEPVPSILRGFSAPVWLDAGLSRDELRFLMASDPDPFNRWEAGQTLAAGVLIDMAADPAMSVDADTVAAFRVLARDAAADKALVAKALTLPGESLIAQRMDNVDPAAIHTARERFRTTLARELRDDFER
ncbi:MAG: aminopeptidase N, partial [Sphingomonadales bacterium]